jgi:hypothetical protein
MTNSADPREFNSDLERVLCVLSQDLQNGSSWLTAADISKILRDNYGLHMHWRTIGSVLRDNKGVAARRKRSYQWQYSILQKGSHIIAKPTGHVTVIDPTDAVQNVITLHEFLSGLSGTISVCDPYFDATSIEHLDSCPDSSAVRLLTYNIKDNGRLRRMISAFARSSRSLEIQKTPVPVIHDRYIIDDKVMTILGTSLNGFGKKHCFLIQAGQDVRATMLSVFNEHWKNGIPWP